MIGDSEIPLIGIPYFLQSGMILFLVFFVLGTVPSSFMKKTSSIQQNTMQNEGRRFRYIMAFALNVCVAWVSLYACGIISGQCYVCNCIECSTLDRTKRVIQSQAHCFCSLLFLCVSLPTESTLNL